jgi:hypothetical protein
MRTAGAKKESARSTSIFTDTRCCQAGLRNQAIARFDRWSISEMAILQQLQIASPLLGSGGGAPHSVSSLIRRVKSESHLELAALKESSNAAILGNHGEGGRLDIASTTTGTWTLIRLTKQPALSGTTVASEIIRDDHIRAHNA